MSSSFPKETIMRLYQRRFTSAQDVTDFAASVEQIRFRLAAVDVRFRLYRSEQDPLQLVEIWTYPDEATLSWARQTINAAAPLLAQFDITTRSDQLRLIDGFDISEDD